MKRRDFIRKAGLAAAAAATGVAAIACDGKEEPKKAEPAKKEEAAKAPAVVNQKRPINGRWLPRGLPSSRSCKSARNGFAQRLEQATEGRIKIQVFARRRTCFPLWACFDAVSEGTVECGSGRRPTTGRARSPRAQWFASVPFGFNPQGINAWFYSGGAIKLWEEVYAPL